MAIITNPTSMDLLKLAACLRDEDRIELMAAGRTNAEEAIRFSVSKSVLLWYEFEDDKPIAIWGCGPLGNVGVPWMLGSVHLDPARHLVVKKTRKCTLKMNRLFPFLQNYVHAPHKASITLLKRVGYKMHETLEAGPFRQPFIRFTREA